uniref:SPX domain-containing protein n=1 Tax=Globisporangium ultimum (strain ATCC 200006 / CBS 805.95 / DAOM BR144) TaxID=431595 RepID=K3WSV9_GLOUD
MVHFNLRLRDNMYAEWRHEYVDYKKLKRLLKKQQQIDASLTVAASTALLDVDTDASSASDDNYAAICSSKNDASANSGSSGGRRSTSSFLRSLAPNSQKAVDTSELQALVIAPAAFEDALEREYDKVENAYIKHVTQFADELALLKDQYRYDAPAATQESLKNSLVELHRLLNLLQNFALLNYTGFIKILKKHDKMFPSLPSLRRDHKRRLQRFAFAEAQQCRELLRELEQVFADLFCESNRSVAIATLMTKKEDFVNWAHIYIGIKIGSCIILLVWVVWDSLVVPTFKSERERHIIDLALTRAYPVYRGIGCLLLLHWLVGLSLYVWRLARINYRYIFELDPRNTQQYAEVFSDATNMTIVFLVNVLLYYKVVNGYFPEAILHRGYYPLLLSVYTFYFYIVRNWGKQHGLLRTLVEIVCSPFYSVTFFHTFVGDYLTSTVKVSQDICWSLCFFATQEFLEKDVIPDAGKRMSPLLHNAALDLGNSDDIQQGGCQNNVYYVNVAVPLICALPLWWRFLQSLRRIYDTETWWPNLPNAFKYALAQVVALFGIFHPFYSGDRDNVEAFQITWIVLFTLSSMYTWVWDVTMDWGLGRPQHKFLGDRQMFSRKWVYYLAIVADLFLRFAWTMTLIPPHSSRMLPLYLLPFTMVGELFRRTFWSFFRLENEHLRNTQGFRRVDFIPLHYDHGVGDDDLDDAKDDLELLNGRVFLMKILLIIFLVLGLSIVAIVVEK